MADFPSKDSATGIWSSREVFIARRRDLWPGFGSGIADITSQQYVIYSEEDNDTEDVSLFKGTTTSISRLDTASGADTASDEDDQDDQVMSPMSDTRAVFFGAANDFAQIYEVTSNGNVSVAANTNSISSGTSGDQLAVCGISNNKFLTYANSEVVLFTESGGSLSQSSTSTIGASNNGVDLVKVPGQEQALLVTTSGAALIDCSQSSPSILDTNTSIENPGTQLTLSNATASRFIAFGSGGCVFLEINNSSISQVSAPSLNNFSGATTQNGNNGKNPLSSYVGGSVVIVQDQSTDLVAVDVSSDTPSTIGRLNNVNVGESIFICPLFIQGESEYYFIALGDQNQKLFSVSDEGNITEIDSTSVAGNHNHEVGCSLYSI